MKSQDIIYLKGYTDTIFCEIVRDNIKNVEYRLSKSSDTSMHIISTNDIEGYIMSDSKNESSQKTWDLSKAQDIIFLKGYADTIYCHIVKDNIKNIEYQLLSNSDTNIYVINSDEIEGYVIASNKNEKKINDTPIFSARDSVFLKNAAIRSNEKKKSTRIYGIIISILISWIASSLMMGVQ